MENARMGRRTVRALVAAMLAVLLAIGMAALALPQRALADYGENLSFTIKVSTESAVGSKDFSGYQVFKANIVGEDGEYRAANVEWADDNVKAAVEAFLGGSDNPAGTSYTDWKAANEVETATAADALAYISEMIEESPSLGSPGGRAPNSASFAHKLAQAIANGSGVTAAGTATATTAGGAVTGLGEGYYVFYNAELPAMWTPVSTGSNEGTVKDPKYLTASKAVSDDGGATWGLVADTGRDASQAVKFRVTGDALEGAPDEGTAFVYNLSDTLPAGLDYVDGSMKVFAVHGNTETELTASDYYTVAYEGKALSVDIASLYATGKAQSSVMRSTDDPVTAIVFEYSATLTADADYGTSLNENKAKISYGAGSADKDTEEAAAGVATYQLLVKKVETGKPATTLADVEFTLKTTVGQAEYYVKADGTLSTEEAVLTTNASGQISVHHIDAGTYTLTEKAAPAGYELPAQPATTIVITPTLNDAEDNIQSLTVTANAVELDDDAVDVANGKVTITIENDPSTVLPITGMTPNQLGTVIGVLLVAAGVVALLVRARRKTRA